MNKIDDQIVGEQKSIIFGSEVLTYSVVGTKLYAYKNSLTNFGSWEYKEIEGLPKANFRLLSLPSNSTEAEPCYMPPPMVMVKYMNLQMEKNGMNQRCLAREWNCY